jgi:hypothetical protein
MAVPGEVPANRHPDIFPRSMIPHNAVRTTATLVGLRTDVPRRNANKGGCLICLLQGEASGTALVAASASPQRDCVLIGSGCGSRWTSFAALTLASLYFGLSACRAHAQTLTASVGP